ncbi:MAG: thiamine phosphate synthase [Pseudomonadota bacterium]
MELLDNLVGHHIPVVDGAVAVSVGVIQRQTAQGIEWLIARREAIFPQQESPEDLWEFPGGKWEAEEQGIGALQREIREEIGIEIQSAEPLIQIPYHAKSRFLWLDVWIIKEFSGEPYGREGQWIRWVSPSNIHKYRFPSANKHVITALQLPRAIVIQTISEDKSFPSFNMQAAVQNRSNLGIRLRLEKKYSSEFKQQTLKNLAQTFQEKSAAQLPIVWFLDIDWFQILSTKELSFHLIKEFLMYFPDHFFVIHLKQRQCKKIIIKILLDKSQFSANYLGFGVSCHSLEELNSATAAGADYTWLSPVCKTATHPEVEPLGWEHFQELVRESPIPVYGLGGLKLEDEQQIRYRGGQGWAGISAWERKI